MVDDHGPARRGGRTTSAVAAASATESGPPEHATKHKPVGGQFGQHLTDRPSHGIGGPGHDASGCTVRSSPRVRGSRAGMATAGPVHTSLKRSRPMSSTTIRTNLAPSRYWAIFASSPSTLRRMMSSGPDPRRRSSNFSRSSQRGTALRRRRCPSDPIRVTLEQAHQSSSRDINSRCSGDLQHRHQRQLVVLARTPPAARRANSSGDTSRSVTSAPMESAKYPDSQGWRRTAPMGLFVKADPHAEIARVGVQLLLSRHDVRGHQQQPGGLSRRRERLELTQHLGRQPAEHGTYLQRVDP